MKLWALTNLWQYFSQMWSRQTPTPLPKAPQPSPSFTTNLNKIGKLSFSARKPNKIIRTNLQDISDSEGDDNSELEIGKKNKRILKKSMMINKRLKNLGASAAHLQSKLNEHIFIDESGSQISSIGECRSEDSDQTINLLMCTMHSHAHSYAPTYSSNSATDIKLKFQQQQSPMSGRMLNRSKNIRQKNISTAVNINNLSNGSNSNSNGSNSLSVNPFQKKKYVHLEDSKDKIKVGEQLAKREADNKREQC